MPSCATGQGEYCCGTNPASELKVKAFNSAAGSGSEGSESFEIIVSDPDPKRSSECWNYPKCETNLKELAQIFFTHNKITLVNLLCCEAC